MDSYPTPQDYNLCSLERKAILKTIHANLDADDISPAFWAACQLADIERLEALSNEPAGVLALFDDVTSQIMTQCKATAPLTGVAANMISKGTQSARESQATSTASEVTGTGSRKRRADGSTVLSRSGLAKAKAESQLSYI